MAQQNDMSVYLLLIAGTEAMMLIAIGIILFVFVYQKKLVRQQEEKRKMELTYQRELNEAGIRVAEDERHRIATDLHDDIGHALLLLRMQTNAAGNISENTLIDSTLEKVRRIAYDLYPPGLNIFGLAHALEDLFEQAGSSSIISIEPDCSQLPKDLTPETALAFYRITQELLSNTIRYAKATAISFSFLHTPGTLLMNYKDNGCGFDLKKGERGLGLLNIENRTNAAGGILRINSSPGNGFEAEIILPYSKKNENS
jgi:signal transduction histidine kinase